MTCARAAWIVLAALTVAYGWFFVAGQPMLQITSCEIGLEPEFYTWEKCEAPIADYYGSAIIGMLAVPVLLCVLPAVAQLRWVAWTVATLLFLGSARGFFSAEHHVTLYGFYVPIAVVAIALASAHRPLSRLHLGTGRRGAERR